MKKIIYPKKNNCVNSCLASIFEVSVDNFPNLYEKNKPIKNWFAVLNQNLAKNFGVIISRKINFPENLDYHLTIVKSKINKKGTHAVVSKNKEIIYDPNFRGKLDYEILEHWILLKL